MATILKTPPPPPPPPAEGLQAVSPVDRLTADQSAAVRTVIEHFAQDSYALTGAEDDEKLLRDEEKFWLSYECIVRYFRATKWAGAQTTIKKLEDTLAWRRQFGFYDGRQEADYVEPEGLTGKCIMAGYDVDGRPALYMVPSRQNTAESMKQIEYTIWLMERCIDVMPPGVETISLMINYGDKADKNPSIAHSRRFVDILQNHYPERLGRAIIINVPFLLTAFYKLVTPFIDPLTRAKMRFNPKLIEEGLFEPEGLWKEFGGNIDFVYEHDEYWPAISKMTSEIREQQMQAWQSLGGTVGIKEWDVKTFCSRSTTSNGAITDDAE